ncbi:MAG: hypothetical protein PHD00_09325 [Bacteroidales bacterium]|nr:hypothetical protein [Bacteroidales bacterium]MDD4672811.1 hypothetical protein [Bacteroidales bacterium]MDY0349346.1 hypothetical protein [Tenuifilaceae bacterium]
MRLNQHHCFTKVIRIFVMVVTIAITTISCSRKTLPSGVEQGLLSNKGYRSEIRKRERIARRADRKTARLERKAKKPAKITERKTRKAQKKGVERHFNNQAPNTQKRMKENQKYTKKNNPPNRPFWKRLKFWKKGC